MHRKRLSFYILSGLLSGVVLVLILTFSFFTINNINPFNLISSVNVLVAEEKISKGSDLNSIAIKSVPKYLAPDNYMDFVPEGKVSLVDIEKNQIITSSMVLDSSDKYTPDSREKDYDILDQSISGIINQGDIIDVEAVTPKGKTYVVLSKKKIIDKYDDKVIMRLTSAERENINYALAQQTNGKIKLASVKYIDSGQPASKVTYFYERRK